MQARKSLLILLNNGVGAVLGLAALFFIGRYTNPEVLGMWGFAYGVLKITAQLSNLGFDSAHIKRVSEGQDLGDCITTFGVIKGTLATGSTLLVIVGAYWWDQTQGFFDATSFRIIVLMAIYFLVFQFNAVMVHTFNALRFAAKTQAMALVENVARTPFIILTALVFGFFVAGQWVPFERAIDWLVWYFHLDGPWTNEQGATALSIAYLIGMLASTVVGVGLFVYHKYPIGRFDRELYRSYLRFAIPIAAISLVGVLLRRVDVVMIGYFWSAADVGFYTAAERIINMILIIPNALAVLFFPLISQLAAKGDLDAVNAQSLQTQRIISFLIMPLAMILIVYAPEIIHIFLADRWLPLAGALQWLVVFVVFNSFVLVARNIIMGFDKPGLTTRISFIMIGLNLVLNTVLIPSSILGVPLFGLRATGAAMATAIAQIVGFGMMLTAAKQLSGKSTIGRSVTLHTVAVLAIGSLLWLTKSATIFGGFERWYHLLFGCTVGGILYLVFLIAVRELTKRDLELALDTFHPGQMARYVRDEVGGRRKE